jgi:hypothetical protein
MRFINLTPHEINIYKDGAPFRVFPPSGQVARISTNTTVVCEVDGVAISMTSYGAPEGLPAPVAGVRYIVSRMLKDALGRNDLVSPEGAVRDAKGVIVGCTSLDVSIPGSVEEALLYRMEREAE